MTRTTAIEWTSHTWNFWAGCSVHSAGCTNCYAMAMAARIERFGNTPHYAGTTRIVNGKPVWTGKLKRASEAQRSKPLSIRRPSLIFVNSMSDWFHEAAPDRWRLEMLRVMREAPQHSFQVLTKRPENIAPFLKRSGEVLPPNFWAGITVERGDFVHRIDILREVPARIRFLSIEPLIGPIGRLDLTGIHWVIAGGESGIGARVMQVDWAREIRDQCIAQGVPFFFKQFGAPRNNPLYERAPDGVTGGSWVKQQDPNGKGGSRLDGREWKNFPQP